MHMLFKWATSHEIDKFCCPINYFTLERKTCWAIVCLKNLESKRSLMNINFFTALQVIKLIHYSLNISYTFTSMHTHLIFHTCLAFSDVSLILTFRDNMNCWKITWFVLFYHDCTEIKILFGNLLHDIWFIQCFYPLPLWIYCLMCPIKGWAERNLILEGRGISNWFSGSKEVSPGCLVYFISSYTYTQSCPLSDAFLQTNKKAPKTVAFLIRRRFKTS